MKSITVDDAIRIATKEVCIKFGISEDIYEQYIRGEIYHLSDIVQVMNNRNTGNFENPYGAGTTLNGCIVYALLRHYNIVNLLETGLGHGFYTIFLLLAANKNNGRLVSVDVAKRNPELGKFLAPNTWDHPRWTTILETNSLDFLETAKRNYGFYSHDSLHTLSHMINEIEFFKKCELDRFVVFIDDQNSEGFWDHALETNLFDKQGYDAKIISGKESVLKGHLGGFVLYERQ